MARILLVDDDVNFTSATEALLRAESHEVQTAGTLKDANQALNQSPYDLLLVDIALPDGNGLELIRDKGPDAIIITGHPSVETAIRAVRGRVVDYLVKPLDRNQLYRAVKAASHLDRSGKFAISDFNCSKIVGDSPAIKALRETIAEYGPTDATVLIMGESGTGKELVAEALHESHDASSKFVTVNCGAIPRELIASELFGHEKGAFTGATSRHQGVFERADGGTVFLDEIGDLPAEQQVALLRVLESQHVMRVGGSKTIPVRVRVISATNTNLEKQVRDGEFREDLFFRLMVLPITVPPLRDRRSDIELLAKHFLVKYAEEYGTPVEVAPDVLERLNKYHWPGNVRELKHALLRAAILNRKNDRIESLPKDFDRPPVLNSDLNRISPGMAIRDVERTLIRKTLEHFDGNRKETAETLGISLKTLYNRLREYENEPDNRSSL